MSTSPQTTTLPHKIDYLALKTLVMVIEVEYGTLVTIDSITTDQYGSIRADITVYAGTKTNPERSYEATVYAQANGVSY